MEEDEKTLSDYIGILKRRRKVFLITASVVLLLSIVIAFILPPVYRSTATILIEQQVIPSELVRSTVTSYADQRVQIISQKVMTTANLTRIIRKYKLYPKDVARKPIEEVLDKMKEDIKLQMISADVVDPKSGRPTKATIAFTLSYDSRSPRKAQLVANELMTLFLQANLKERKQKASETSQFLANEAQRLRREISTLEKKLADFKTRHANSLPELVQLNMQLLQRTETELKDVERQLRSLKERKIFLRSQLAQINPYTGMVTATGEKILSPSERLRALEAEYVSKQARYAPNHPDLVKMRREIAALKKEVGGSGDTEELKKQLFKARAELALIRKKYAANHPDVKKLQARIRALEKTIRTASAGKRKPIAKKPDNPAWIQIKAQLDAAISEEKSYKRFRDELRKKRAEYEKRIVSAPQVEREYRAITRDYENAVRKYQDIKAKQREAEIAVELEKDSKGEKFTVIDPPQLPEKAEKPNRVAIVFLGFVLAFAGGLGGVFMSESLDRRIYHARDVANVLGAPPLAAIPYIRNSADENVSKRSKWVIIGITVGLIAALLLLVHFLYKPLDVLWFVIQRKLGL